VYHDRGEFGKPLVPPRGVKWVILNGKIAVEDGNVTEPPSGKMLLR